MERVANVEEHISVRGLRERSSEMMDIMKAYIQRMNRMDGLVNIIIRYGWLRVNGRRMAVPHEELKAGQVTVWSDDSEYMQAVNKLTGADTAELFIKYIIEVNCCEGTFDTCLENAGYGFSEWTRFINDKGGEFAGCFTYKGIWFGDTYPNDYRELAFPANVMKAKKIGNRIPVGGRGSWFTMGLGLLFRELSPGTVSSEIRDEIKRILEGFCDACESSKDIEDFSGGGFAALGIYNLPVSIRHSEFGILRKYLEAMRRYSCARGLDFRVIGVFLHGGDYAFRSLTIDGDNTGIDAMLHVM